MLKTNLYSSNTSVISGFLPEVHSYGFNGMEKQNEQTTGNYDFGARILDTRLGRWLSVDHYFKLQPAQSTYKVNKNNPVIFTDPDGHTEILTIIIKDQHGHQITHNVELSEDVMTDGVKVASTIYLFGQPWGTEVNTNYYDFSTTITYTIDDNGNTLSMGIENKILYENGVKDEDTVFSVGEQDQYGDIKDPDGFNNSDFQDDGFHLTSESGGSSPTNTKSKNGGESRDIGDFLAAVGKFTKDPSKIPSLNEGLGAADLISCFEDIRSEVAEVIAKQSTQTKAAAATQPKIEPQPVDSFYIEYTKITKHKSSIPGMPSRESHSPNHQGVGVLPKDTVNDQFKNDPNTIVTGVKKK